MNIFEDIFQRESLWALFADPAQLFVLMLVSIALSFVIAYAYKATHRGFSYSQSFSIAIILMTVIVTMIIFLIEDSIARAIGIFGAFSIIRFRTAVKDVRDVVFIFFALAIGLAVGLGSISTAAMGVFVLTALLLILHKTNFGGMRKLEYVLHFKMDSKNHSNDVFAGVMDKFLKKRRLLNVSAKERGKYLLFTFNISLRDQDELNDFIAGMNVLEGVSDVSVISSKNDLEF
jgi:uncharacterized membrane protein YhiD involved in acid resistance